MDRVCIPARSKKERRGLVFDIEEFGVFDGPVIRTVVFLKGCPLRCRWCHNPEGLSPRPTRVKTLALCEHCGACDAVCPTPNACTGCGLCVSVCPKGCLRIAGTWMEPEQVAARVLRNADLLRMNGGGVTFSGGEPLLQADFVIACTESLGDLHCLMETSGYSTIDVFQRTACALDMVIFDVKLVDPVRHLLYTGVDNTPILRNLDWLKRSGIPFRVRVPLIPMVNDDAENLRRTAELLHDSAALEKVELMRYNKAAGAKYTGVGLIYEPGFPEDAEPATHMDIFEEAGIPCDIL